MHRRWLVAASAGLLAFTSLPAAIEVRGPVILLIGPPGSGKSTQAEFLRKTYAIPTVSAEELIRANPSVFARAAQPVIQGVEPRSDPALNKLLRQKLEEIDISKGFALDGYPAAKGHADYFGALMAEWKLPKPTVLQLTLPDDVVRKRLSQRKGPDDKPDTVEQLLKDYHREMGMIRAFFPDADIVTIDAAKKSKAVSKQIKKAIDQRLKK